MLTRRSRRRAAATHRPRVRWRPQDRVWMWCCDACGHLGYGPDLGPVHDSARRHVQEVAP